MTALLEFKQKIKGIYAQYDMYLLPLLKFVLALVYFIWINTNMGYMTALDNIFVVLILSLICCILPSGMMIFAGFALMVGHCYALGIEVAAFLLVLILFMMILFLRFSSGKNIVLVFTPLAFAFDIPVLLPIGCGLLSSAVSALPAAGGVIIYYFVRTVRIQSQALLGMDSDIVGKLTLLSDSLMKNGEMWLTLIAFIVVVLAVNLIRTRMFDYAWRIAIVAGGVIYIVIMLAGSMSLGISISVFSLIIYTVVAVLVGIILEFFVFGGDYTRTERLEYEDDDYYYYVKAVPKALVATSERSIKKINGESAREERKSAERVVNYSTPLFQGEEPPKKKKRVQETEAASVVQKADIDDIDFEGRECVVYGKGDKERRVYFDAKTKVHLKEYIENRIDENTALFVTLDAPYNRLKISGVEIRLRKLGRELNLERIHPHKFRRSMATRAIDKGMPIEQVQKILGHSQIDTTMQYAMVNQNNVKSAHQKYMS